MKKRGLIVAALLLTGCQSVYNSTDEALAKQTATVESRVAQVERHFCLFEEPNQDIRYNCDPRYWLNTWILAANTPWSVRKEQFSKLDNSIMGILHRYILALPSDTPYQIRLQTQLALDDIALGLTPPAKAVIDAVASEQNNQLMQLESALVVIEKENTQRGERLQVLEQEAANLRAKLEELLRIEATLMDKNRSTQP